jgi:hypothetical protein
MLVDFTLQICVCCIMTGKKISLIFAVCYLQPTVTTNLAFKTKSFAQYTRLQVTLCIGYTMMIFMFIDTVMILN